jgi:hypothetical protein
MMSARGLAACVLALLAAPLASAADLRFEATTTWAENITRASAAGDWRDAHRHEARVAAGWFREWATGFLTSGEVDAGLEYTSKFTGLNTASLGLSGQARQKFGFGAYAPTVAVDAGLRYRDARLDFADGWTATAGLRVSTTGRATSSTRGITGSSAPSRGTSTTGSSSRTATAGSGATSPPTPRRASGPAPSPASSARKFPPTTTPSRGA